MSDKYDRKKLFLIAVSAVILVVGSQFVQPSLAQDLSQLGQQVKEKIGGVLGQLTDKRVTKLLTSQLHSATHRSSMYQPSQPINAVISDGLASVWLA